MAENRSVSRPVVLFMSAPHCHACRSMRPSLEAVAAGFEASVGTVHVDVSREPELARRHAVLGTPTLIALHGEEELARVTGRVSPNQLHALYASVSRAEPAKLARPVERRFGLVAGTALGLLGLVTGPAWPLIAASVVIAAWALIGTRA